MIFRLGLPFGTLDAPGLEICAQPRQRPLMQEAGQVVRSVGQKLAAPEADEEIEIFPLDALRIGLGCSRSKDVVGQRQRIAGFPAATEAGQAFQEIGIRAANQQRREQCVSARARRIDLTIGGWRGSSSKRSGRNTRRSTPVAASTDATRSAGTRSQLETDGCEMPMRRASSLIPPAARIASSSP